MTAKAVAPAIQNISGWWYIVGLGDFYMYPFPTRADAEEALTKLTEQPP